MLGDEIGALVGDAIIPRLAATNKADAIQEIVDQLSELGMIERTHSGEIAQSILKREELGSTGIGGGFAVPHAKHALVDRLAVALAFSHEGIEFDSIDGLPVHTMFLFISPAAQPNDHLRALQRISKYLVER